MATLTHEIGTLQYHRWKVSTLFLDIKAGFENIDAVKLRAMFLKRKAFSYMLDWISSFLMERICTLVF